MTPPRPPRKNILLGVCGSSAADDVAALVKLLQTFIAPSVVTVCTPSAVKFINLPAGQFTEDSAWHSAPLHVDLTVDAEEFIVCPATANTLAKSALGIADTLLTTCILAYHGPIWFFPFANQALWDSAPTQAHVATLRSRNHHVITPQAMLGVGEDGRTKGVGCEWRTVITTVLEHYLHDLG
ncbi:flavoprotein [Streptosporangium lutulentum]|uniref:Phosphopantothenoylcysteine decarboxylase/phosphopantothenate--cysteine ligase n=1 Tax=Streptosporangium lutulentum TaxID=1461250 RepID=A0ABT9QWW6_9ACTN|nr:flavoprotein [Streptosporangium lutulentum]MDP9850449.1 phosphopantothenoylcysteine decarboxylase/phosphopantothenate--cysteine ligase [Streptosporangium lutulentum]